MTNRFQDWIRHALRHPAIQAMVRRVRPLADSALYPVLAGALAFGGAISMTLPNVPLVCALVALNGRRWRRIAVWMAAGSALAAALVAFLIERWGREFVAVALPQLVATAPWGALERWIADWGFLVLFAVTATPLSQTPAILAAALLGMPAIEVFAAALLGKLVKYAAVAYLTQRTVDGAAGAVTGR